MTNKKKRTAHSHEIYEVFINNLKMNFKMLTHLFIGFFIIYSLLLIIIIKQNNNYEKKIAIIYERTKIFGIFCPNKLVKFPMKNGKIAWVKASTILLNDQIIKLSKIGKKIIYEIMFKTSSIFLLLPVLIFFLKFKAEKRLKTDHVRGAEITTACAFEKQTKNIKKRLPIGSISMPFELENRHAFIIGRPGTGKTVLLSAILTKIIESNEKAIVYDFKGDYFNKFYDPDKDFLFNPFDKRSIHWNLFDQIVVTTDIESLATSLIPITHDEKEKFWSDGARAVLIGILHYLYQNEKKTNADIWNTVCLPTSKIKEKLLSIPEGYEGVKYIEKTKSEQAMAIISKLMQYIRSLRFMDSQKKGFSINEWMKTDGGIIYVTNYAVLKDALSPILTLFMDTIAKQLLTLPNNISKRCFFLFDEFGSLCRMSSIVQLLTLSRSKGGSVWIGIQDFSQIDTIYSANERQTIVNSCGNHVIFSVGAKTAKIASEEIIGEKEYFENERSVSIGPTDFKDGKNMSERKKKDSLILASELDNLNDLEAYVKFRGYKLFKINLEFKNIKNKNEDILFKKALQLSQIHAPKCCGMEMTFANDVFFCEICQGDIK